MVYETVSDTNLHVDPVARVQTEGPSEVEGTYDLDDVDIMGSLRDDDGAVDVTYLGLVGYDVPETASTVRESGYEYAGCPSDDVQLPDVCLVYGHVECAFEGHESEFLDELIYVSFLADVVSAFAHPVSDGPVYGYVVGQFKDPSVFVVFFFEFVDTCLGDLDPLFSGAEIPYYEVGFQQFKDSLRCRLLAHLQGFSQLPRGDGGVVFHRTEQSQFSQCVDELFVHG